MKTSNAGTSYSAVALAAVTVGTAYGQHQGDIWVGVSSEGQLRIDAIQGFDPVRGVVQLESASGLIKGWTAVNPGFDHVHSDYPARDLYRLGTGADVWLRAVSLSPALRYIDPTFAMLDDPGDELWLGDSTLHVHYTWNINSQDAEFAGYSAGHVVWEGTFVLEDSGATGYADSEPFTIRFVNQAFTTYSDLDLDGDVDGFDFLTFSNCYNGSSRPILAACASGLADLEFDGDVDGFDFLTFANCYNGSGRIPLCD